MTEEMVKTIAFSVVLVCAVHALAVYAVVRLLTTGHALFERRTEDSAPKIHRLDR